MYQICYRGPWIEDEYAGVELANNGMRDDGLLVLRTAPGVWEGVPVTIAYLTTNGDPVLIASAMSDGGRWDLLEECEAWIGHEREQWLRDALVGGLGFDASVLAECGPTCTVCSGKHFDHEHDL